MSPFGLNKKNTFEEVFPEIEYVRLEYEERTMGAQPLIKGTHEFERGHGTPEFLAHINCSNPQCSEGGLSMVAILNVMVAGRETRKDFTIACPGFERFRRCVHFWKGVVTVRYAAGPVGQDAGYDASYDANRREG